MIPRTIVAAALLALPVIGYPQQTSQQTSLQTARFRVEGTISAVQTSQPLAGVQVSLGKETASGTLPPDIAPVLTDDRGRFVFNNLDEGSYRLGAIKNGYVRGYHSDIIILKADQQTVDLTLQLTPAATITGHVRDASGKPVADVPMELLKRTYSRDGLAFQVAGRTQSNDLGEYRFYWIAPGTYYLAAGSKEAASTRVGVLYLDEDLRNGRNRVEVDYAYRYYPGVTDIGKATMLDIQPGSQHSDLDFTVTTQQFFRIRGKVIDSSTNQPPPDVDFGWSGGGDPTYDRTTGTFEFTKCRPDTYGIGISHNSMRAFTTVVVHNSDVEGLSLRLEPAAVIRGRIQVDGTFPAGRLQNMRVQLRQEERSGYFAAPSTEVHADGTFTVEDIPTAVSYRVTLFGLPSGFYLKEARLGGSNAVWDYARVTDSADLQIVLSSRVARVHGVVTGNPQQSMANIEVALLPAARDRSELAQSVLTDKDGRFNFPRIPPGDYKLFAFDGLERSAFFDPEVLAPFEERGKPIHLVESSDETMDLKAISVRSTP